MSCTRCGERCHDALLRYGGTNTSSTLGPGNGIVSGLDGRGSEDKNVPSYGMGYLSFIFESEDHIFSLSARGMRGVSHEVETVYCMVAWDLFIWGENGCHDSRS